MAHSENQPAPKASPQHVLWDWNGTLLDDVDLCLNALHALCKPRGIPLLTLEKYRETFTFPVVDYYRSVGFDFNREPFDVLAQEWVDIYTARIWTDARLYEGVPETLAHLREAGIPQSILSAHQHDMLVGAVQRFGLLDFFEAVLGLGDFYAKSKVDLGKAWLAKAEVDPRRVVLIGDTLHDHEVAEGLGIHCILVAQGHQSRARLQGAGVPVLDAVDQLPGFLAQGFPSS